MALVAVLLAGSYLRLPAHLFNEHGSLHRLVVLHPQPMNQHVGFDEHLYAEYATKLNRFGLLFYPEIVQRYRERQQLLTGSVLPPVRFLYIFAGASWHSLFRSEPLLALRDVAAAFSILTLLLATLFAARVGGRASALGVAALMAFAPTQLHMSQHALADGFFTFWATLALWLLWENLRAPRRRGWLVALGCALIAIVLTKENAFFALVAFGVILVSNQWLNFGKVTRELVATLILGPVVGCLILALLSGGVLELIATYRLSVSMNYQLKYAILTGDGPWYRYLVDLLLVNPLVLLLAIGRTFTLTKDRKPEWFLLIFIAASYAIMCNIKYGLNLRYANMWDFPLCFCAFSELVALATVVSLRWRTAVLSLLMATISLLELHNYNTLAVKYPLYELVTPDLMRALSILKTPSSPEDLLPPHMK